MLDVVFDARMINNSGIGTYCKAILPWLINRYDCIILGDYDELKCYLPEIQRKSVLDFNVKIYSIKEQFQYSSQIPSCKLFWSPHYNVPLFGIKAQKRLVTIHDVYPLAYFRELSFKKKLYARIMFNKAIHGSDQIITVSEFSKKEIMKYSNVEGSKIEVIHNALHLDKVVPSISEDYEFKINGPYILYVGNVKPHKNLKKLVKAFSIVQEKEKDLQLVIIGKKEGFITGDNDVIETAKRIKNIHFTGYVSNETLRDIYMNSSIFVIPSLYEGFGYPIVEAMFYNIPILASNIDVFKEVAMDAAIFFDPHNEMDIAEKILRTYRSEMLRKKLIEKGKIRVERSFTHERFVEEHLNIIDQLL